MVPPSPVALGVWTRIDTIIRTPIATSRMISALRTLSMAEAECTPLQPPPAPRGRLATHAQALLDGAPVDRVPPGGHVVGALVLVLEVVGVLPHVHAKDRDPAFHDRVVLVRKPLHLQLAAGQEGP